MMAEIFVTTLAALAVMFLLVRARKKYKLINQDQACDGACGACPFSGECEDIAKAAAK